METAIGILMAKNGIEATRREIDVLDGEIHALLARRMEKMGALGEAKRASGEKSAYRPEREAALFRARAAAHQGAMALESLLRIWQEICAAAAEIQMGRPLRAALFAPQEKQERLWEIARAQCGARGSLRLCESAEETLQAARDDPSLLALLPAPDAFLTDWWRLLSPPLQIVARLPLWIEEAASPALYGVMLREWRASGEDITLLRAKMEGGAEMRETLKASALMGEIIGEAEGEMLLALEGFVAKEDQRLKDFAEKTRSLAYLGGFAKPLVAQPLRAKR